MSNPTFNFNGPIGQVNTGNVTVAGDNIGTQNNYHGTNADYADLVRQLDDLTQRLQDEMKIDPTQDDQQFLLVQAGKAEIEKTPTLRDRLVAALKAGAFETLKQLTNLPVVQVLIEAFKAAMEAK